MKTIVTMTTWNIYYAWGRCANLRPKILAMVKKIWFTWPCHHHLSESNLAACLRIERAIFFQQISDSPERGEINKTDKQRSTLSPVIYVGKRIARFPLQLSSSRAKPPVSRWIIPQWLTRGVEQMLLRQFGKNRAKKGISPSPKGEIRNFCRCCRRYP